MLFWNCGVIYLEVIDILELKLSNRTNSSFMTWTSPQICLRLIELYRGILHKYEDFSPVQRHDSKFEIKGFDGCFAVCIENSAHQSLFNPFKHH